jgi:hypothetical protein
MALTEDIILSSVTIHLSQKTIDVAWQERILRDGVMISSSPKNGCYPLNENGEPDESVISELGVSIADLLGQAGADAQLAVHTLSNQIQEKNALIVGMQNTISDLENQLIQLQNKE